MDKVKSYILRRDNLGANCFLIPNIPLIKNSEPLPPAEFVIRWGTTSNVPGKPKIINKASAIHETSSKGTFRKKVADAGFAPKTWTRIQDYLGQIDSFIPVIVRPINHERSEDLYFCERLSDVGKAISNIKGDFYISEYIPKDREFRVFMAQGRIFILVEKNTDDKTKVSWGCVDQGKFDYIGWEDWPQAVVECAINSFNLTDLEFGAVDIIMKGKTAYFLEANTAPELGPYYGECFGKVFSWMIDKDNRDRLPIKDMKGGWKNTIHPAMSERAIV